MRRSWKLALTGCALLAVSACGTTVPLSSQSRSEGSSLDVPSASPQPTRSDGVVPGSPADGTGSVPGTVTQDGPTSGARPEPSAAAEGSGPVAVAPPSRNRSPLKIGVIYLTDGGAAQSLGLNQGTSEYTPEQVARGLVKGFNSRGGLFGRRLDAVYAGWSTSSNNYSVDAAAMCARFTQDTPVPVVLDLGVGNLGGLPECLARRGIVHLSTGFETDLKGLRALPLHVNTAFLSIERTYLNTLDRLMAVNYLTRSSKLGVVQEECTDDVRAYRDVILPRIKQTLGQTPLLVTTRCSNGISGASSASADISNAVLRFKGAKVDRVLFISRYESIVLLLFSNAAESQAYRPGYALSSYAGAAAISPSLQARQRPGLHGAGWRPALDTSDATFRSAPERHCTDVFNASGSTARLKNDVGAVAVSCAPFLVLERLLDLSRGAFTRDAVTAAISRFGSATQLPTVLGGRAALGADRRDMPAAGQAFGYVSSCTCIRYQGAAGTIS